jgi:hypothetical protein
MGAIVQSKPRIVTHEQMVTRLVVVRTMMAELKAEDRKLSDILLRAYGPGELFGVSGEKVFAICPSPKIAIAADKVPLLKEILGENFDKLIEQIKTWKAVEACRKIAERILKPITLRKFLANTEVESAPYIRIS